MSFAPDAITTDKFLGGLLMLKQPQKGYRAGVDPVFLAASVDARAGQSVLELGCGAGAAILCLGTRIPGLRLAGVEKQPEYADLARRNAVDNQISLEVVQADITILPPHLREEIFDHVIMNPPYHLRNGGALAPDAGREAAIGEQTPLLDWVHVATKRLRPRGYLTMIQKAERLPEILCGFDSRMGSVIVKPLSPRDGRAPTLVLVQARKGGRGEFHLTAPLVLHEGPEHLEDRDSYRPEIRALLRDGAALPLR